MTERAGWLTKPYPKPRGKQVFSLAAWRFWWQRRNSRFAYAASLTREQIDDAIRRVDESDAEAFFMQVMFEEGGK